MIVVHKFTSAWGQPDISPFVLKLETYLRMAGIAYVGRRGDPRQAPKGKLPYIDDGDLRLGDSFFIIEHLKSRYGDTLDADLSPMQRAIATAVRAMLEEQLYFLILYYRWQSDVGFRDYKPVLSAYMADLGVPRVLRPILLVSVRRKIVHALRVQGIGRHEAAEVAVIGRGIVESLEELLGDRPFFFGARATSLDAIVYPFISAFVDTPIQSPIRDRLCESPNLLAYCERIKALYWA